MTTDECIEKRAFDHKASLKQPKNNWNHEQASMFSPGCVYENKIGRLKLISIAIIS